MPRVRRVLASLGSVSSNTVYELPHVRIRVIASGTVRDGTLRGSPHLCRPIRSFSLRTVVAHPFPAGRCLRLPGRACVRHARQASASSEGSFVSLRWCCRTTIRACGVFAPPSPGHPKAKRPGCSRPRRTDGGLKHESYLSAVPCSSPSLSAAPVRRAQTRLYRTLAHATFRPRAEFMARGQIVSQWPLGRVMLMRGETPFTTARGRL